MKKKIGVLLVTVMAALSLTGCGTFKCDMCGEEKSGSKHSYSFLGQDMVICDDCYEGVQILNGLFN